MVPYELSAKAGRRGSRQYQDLKMGPGKSNFGDKPNPYGVINKQTEYIRLHGDWPRFAIALIATSATAFAVGMFIGFWVGLCAN